MEIGAYMINWKLFRTKCSWDFKLQGQNLFGRIEETPPDISTTVVGFRFEIRILDLTNKKQEL
jgi:hypothetical protein